MGVSSLSTDRSILADRTKCLIINGLFSKTCRVSEFKNKAPENVAGRIYYSFSAECNEYPLLVSKSRLMGFSSFAWQVIFGISYLGLGKRTTPFQKVWRHQTTALQFAVLR